MWVKKIIVRTAVASFQDVDMSFRQRVTREFTFYYTPLTKIKKLLLTVYKECRFEKPYQEEKKHFFVYRHGEQLLPDEDGVVAKLIKYLECENVINIEYVIWNGIGAELDRIDGIRYFYHTKERRHVPHIHAEHQGEEISIEIISLKVKGKFKNGKKQKKAIQYVRDRQDMLLEEYNNKTNGIHVYDYWS